MNSRVRQPFPYVPPPELRAGRRVLHPVVIVGAGPVGLAAAIDLALHGVRSIVLDDNDVVSVGSRAICWSKRSLEIFDRLGVGERMARKGITWRIGRVYHRDRELYNFDLLPQRGHKMPAFVNLQQYYVEQYLVERAGEFADLIEVRWKNRFCGVRHLDDRVLIDVETPDGPYQLEASWLIAADGARSTVRDVLGLDFAGHVFEEKFLIADVRMQAEFPSDRRFWFEPTFDPGESVLIHRQPDDVFRIDFQLGWDADAQAERRPERVMDRVRRVVGPQIHFELEWCSVYTFRCARLERFVHGRVLFAGDSAHVVSPFGARGGNSGIQDIDNLCWKLAMVVAGRAPMGFLDSYDEERGLACEENLRHSSRTTRFMTPKTRAERQLRDAVLALARGFPFARGLVNSGRLSQPCSLARTSCIGADDSLSGGAGPGMSCPDAPVVTSGTAGWLLESLGGTFTVLTFAADATDVEALRAKCAALGEGVALLVVVPEGCAGEAPELLVDVEGLARDRYCGAPGVTYLIRPDQHVAARYGRFDVLQLRAAFAHAIGNDRGHGDRAIHRARNGKRDSTHPTREPAA